MSFTTRSRNATLLLLLGGAWGCEHAEAHERGEPVDDALPTERHGAESDGPALDVTDRDGDTFPDVVETLEGSDPLDITDTPAGPLPSGGFPSVNCRAGFIQAGARLCISASTQNSTTFRSASIRCREQRAHVCTYEDLTYLYYQTNLDATYNPEGAWIGNMVADDNALCGNRRINSNNDPNIVNFEGTCGKNDNRAYWCCHDDE